MMDFSRDKTTWVIVGGAPSAPRYFDALMGTAAGARATWIACNCAWQLFVTRLPMQVPDYYWLSDPHAIELFDRAARFMQGFGTKLISHVFITGGVYTPGHDRADLYVDLPEPTTPADYLRDQRVHPRFTGLLCLQFALATSPQRVVLVGMDGHRSRPGRILPDTFDGRPGKATHLDSTGAWIERFTRSAIAAHPETEFLVCGDPAWSTAGLINLTVHRDVADAAAALAQEPAHAA